MMRARRDPFARQTARPTARRENRQSSCSWCGQGPAPRRPLYTIVIEDDAGAHRNAELRGVFESWACAEAYHGTPIAR